MSARPPWIKPAISFGLPLLAVVVALPFITGHGYSFPAFGEATRSLKTLGHEARHAVLGADASTKVRFYECRSATGKVLSDKPCGAQAKVHDIDAEAVNHMAPPPAPPPPSQGNGLAQPHDGSPAGILAGVRSDLAAAQSVDERRRAAAEADAE